MSKIVVWRDVIDPNTYHFGIVPQSTKKIAWWCSLFSDAVSDVFGLPLAAAIHNCPPGEVRHLTIECTVVKIDI